MQRDAAVLIGGGYSLAFLGLPDFSLSYKPLTFFSLYLWMQRLTVLTDMNRRLAICASVFPASNHRIISALVPSLPISSRENFISFSFSSLLNPSRPGI